jgi:putative transposase
MARLSHTIRHLLQCAYIFGSLLFDAMRFLRLCLRSPATAAAENLFLRTQLALYQERHITPQRATNATRLAMVWLSQWFDWQQAVTVGQPEPFQRWQHQGVSLFWRWQSKPGWPPIPVELQALIQQMARDNLTWGQRRIANELLLKLGSLNASECVNG